MAHIFSVSELTFAVKDVLESEFPFVWVRGQVSDVSRPSSGHVYFSLKDEQARLSVVWFRRNRRHIARGEADPVSGEIFENGFCADIDNGQQVLVAGRLNIYPVRGHYQLIAEFVQAEGVSRLALEFEALKSELAEAGYFDESRKKNLPSNPQRIAVITSPSGAAIQDFLRIADQRGLGTQIRIYPVLVQGDESASQIARALTQAEADNWAQVVCLLRGGGSLEDLWSFNTKEVATAVFHLSLPVVSGIGHEVDFTIADFSADVRAATPSHAAQLLFTRRLHLFQRVENLYMTFQRRMDYFLSGLEQDLAGKEKALQWLSPVKRIQRLRQYLHQLEQALIRRNKLFFGRKKELLTLQYQNLLRSFGTADLNLYQLKTENLSRRLHNALNKQLQKKEQNLAILESDFKSKDPKAPLKRGYGLIEIVEKKRYLQSIKQVKPGDDLKIRVFDGQLKATVTGVKAQQEYKKNRTKDKKNI